MQVDEIPLPQMVTATAAAELPNGPPNMFAIPGRIPLPNTLPPVMPPFNTAPPSLAAHLKKPPPVIVEAIPEKVPEKKKKEPPGCPPGPPPSLFDMPELDSDYEDDEPLPPKTKRAKTTRPTDSDSSKTESSRDEATPKAPEPEVLKPTSLQQRMLAISGQNIDEFMKEMENVQKKKEQERAADLQERLSTLEKDGIGELSGLAPTRETGSECESLVTYLVCVYLCSFELSADTDSDDGEDVDDNENKHRDDQTDETDSSNEDDDDDEDSQQIRDNRPVQQILSIPPPVALAQPVIKLPSGPPPPPIGLPPAMMFRPPPMRQMGMGIRMPPGKLLHKFMIDNLVFN